MNARFPHGVLHALVERWRSPCGYREVLIIAGPLILTTGAFSIQHFVDRMFLTWYSSESVAAAMGAGMLYFTVFCLFMGTVRYSSVFVAQYFGNGQDGRVGPVLWQGLYVGLAGSVIVLLTIPLARPVFEWIGHEPSVREEEITYYRILCVGAIPGLIASSMDGFFTGLGRTWPLVWISVATTCVNLALDFLLIFGAGPIPSMGIAGAAWATVIAQACSVGIYVGLLARRRYDERFALWRGRGLDRELCWRLLRFGLPSGIQFFIDVVGFSIFVLMLGRLGTVALTASTIAFNINILAFMPMIGTGIAVSILVGQHIGAGEPGKAEKSVYSGFHITLAYMIVVGLSYALLPGLYIAPFAAKADPETFPEVARMVRILLRFVAFYSLFDGCNIIFSSAVKGAGDTRFVMVAMGALALFGLVLPSLLVIKLLPGMGIYGPWTVLTAYVLILAAAFLARFRAGHWKSMRVTDEAG